MKIAYVTEALSNYVSGGILVLVKILNELKKNGHDVCCFIKHPPFESNWIKANFPIYSMGEMDDYNGILVSTFSPVSEVVSKAKNAQDLFYHVHSMENKFSYNGLEWTKQAENSYKLPLKIFCTSTYVQIMMEMAYNRYVIGQLVAPGVDVDEFEYVRRDFKLPLKVGILMRGDYIRGNDIAWKGFQLAKNNGANIELIIQNPTPNREEMVKFYQSIDLFIDMSRLAGSPTCAKECMATGAIPTFTKYGTTDFILNGHNGFIMPVDDHNKLANVLIYLSQPDQTFYLKELSLNAHKESLNYSWDLVAQRFIKAIEEGISRGDELLRFRQW